jgi:5-methylcytosine-specific restriction endonuclease McrA
MKTRSQLEKMVLQSTKRGLKRRPITESEIRKSETGFGGFTVKVLRGWGVPNHIKGWKRLILKHGVPLLHLDDLGRYDPSPEKSARSEIKEKIREPKSAPAPKAAKDAFYASWEWRTLRMQVLKEHGPACQCCGARPGQFDSGGAPVKIVVDHIKPLSRYWHLRLEKTNLQVLCDECNQGKGAWDETDHRPAAEPEGSWLDEEDAGSLIDQQLRYVVN